MAVAGGVGPASGSKLFIGTTATNGASDSYTQVAEIINMGEFGRVYAPITYDSLSNRNTIKFKGQRDDGNMQLQLGKADVTDAGQVAIKVALDNDQDFNFKVELNDSSEVTGATPTTFIFKAKVMSYTTNIGAPNNVVSSSCSLALTSGSIIETLAT